MSEDDLNLEEIIRRPMRPDGGVTPPSAGTDTLGQCGCGARIARSDVYGERGGVDLGGPRRRLAVRLLQYCCPLCGHTGELLVDG
jgi:hypothetical protein